MLADFNPAPSAEVQKKFDFFYKPYAPLQVLSKYVRFENEEAEEEKKQGEIALIVKIISNSKVPDEEKKYLRDVLKSM